MTLPTTLKRFTHPDAWRGNGAHVGAHGLSLRYRRPTPARLQAARDALWTFPGVEGPWRRHDREPAAASRIPSTCGLEHDQPLFGLAHLPGTGGVACRAVARVEDLVIDHDCPLCREVARLAGPPSGWLDLAIPFGSLGLVYPIGAYPEEDGTSLAWRDEVDGWLRALAGHVHRAAPFDLALVGWPGGDFTPLPQTTDDLWEQRGLGYLFPGPDGLTWFPPTTGAPIPADLAADLRELDGLLDEDGPAEVA